MKQRKLRRGFLLRAGGPPLLIVKPHGGRNLGAMVDVTKVLELLEPNREGDHE